MPESAFRLLLFLSCDIVGSTGFKRECRRDGGEWSELFASFLRDFPSDVSAAAGGPPFKLARIPNPWKFLGDEIVFVVELKQAEEAILHLRAFERAMQKHQGDWHDDHSHQRRLKLKATAWIAGFPCNNLAHPFPGTSDQSGGGRLEDYLGPDIDTGFRLSKFATPSRVPVSASLAMLLVGTERDTSSLLHFEGRVELRGHESPYPLFWLPVSPKADRDIDRLEDGLLGRNPVSNRDALDYLEALLDEQAIPFIEDGDSGSRFDGVPEWARRRVETLQQQELDPSDSTEPIVESGTSDEVTLDVRIDPTDRMKAPSKGEGD